jgi:hypothetical protein
MFKRRAELIDGKGVAVATFNETCHDYGTMLATVKLPRRRRCLSYRTPRSSQSSRRVSLSRWYSVEASDPTGTEIREFHGTSAIGCVPDGRGSRW